MKVQSFTPAIPATLQSTVSYKSAEVVAAVVTADVVYDSKDSDAIALGKNIHVDEYAQETSRSNIKVQSPTPGSLTVTASAFPAVSRWSLPKKSHDTLTTLPHSTAPASAQTSHARTNPELDADEAIIYGADTISAPSASYTIEQRKQRIDAYASRVLTKIGNMESGSEAERNVKFQNVRPFLEPGGYFSGGLLAAGYDPHEKITVTFTSYRKELLGGKTNMISTDTRIYSAWEVAAGAFAHDKVESGGPINFQFMNIKKEDRSKVGDLESLGSKLQDHWENEIAKPMRYASGALAQRSGKADAYVIRGILQSLASDKAGFEKLSIEGQAAISRVLKPNEKIIIPNLYGYPLAGYAFITYTPYDDNYEHRPNQGLMVDLKNGTVHEIHGDDDFAEWAKNNRDNLQRSFNALDRQGGKDAHWPKTGDLLDWVITNNGAHVEGPFNGLIPVRESFNYTISHNSDYYLRHGFLDGNIAEHYKEVNSKNANAVDQTEVFGSSQQSWKAAKEFWGNTFGYLPIVGNTGNIVFGAHDGIYGKTADDRVGGNAAAVISTLQLAHELAPIGVEAKLGEPPVAFNPSTSKNYSWRHNPKTNDFELVQVPKAPATTDAVFVSTQGAPEVIPTPETSLLFPGMREVEFRGRTYFAADNPDAGDGMHYVLRIKNPRDPGKLASSSIIAKPDEMGAWKRRGVVGGGRELIDSASWQGSGTTLSSESAWGPVDLARYEVNPTVNHTPMAAPQGMEVIRIGSEDIYIDMNFRDVPGVNAEGDNINYPISKKTLDGRLAPCGEYTDEGVFKFSGNLSPSRHYIQLQGRIFKVIFDHDRAAWSIVPPTQATAGLPAVYIRPGGALGSWIPAIDFADRQPLVNLVQRLLKLPESANNSDFYANSANAAIAERYITQYGRQIIRTKDPEIFMAPLSDQEKLLDNYTVKHGLPYQQIYTLLEAKLTGKPLPIWAPEFDAFQGLGMVPATADGGGLNIGKVFNDPMLHYPIRSYTQEQQAIIRELHSFRASSEFNVQRGALNEQLLANILESDGYTILPGGKYGNDLHGFDLVVQGPNGDVYVLESKQLRRGGGKLSTLTLGKKGAGKQAQMSNAWVKSVLENCVREAFTSEKIVVVKNSPAYKAVEAASRAGTLGKLVGGTTPEGQVLIFKLDLSAFEKTHEQ